jgi:hypothetical protein
MTPILRTALLVIIAALTSLVISNHSHAAGEQFADVRGEITSRHDEALKRLRDWIALPSIAAEDRN